MKMRDRRRRQLAISAERAKRGGNLLRNPDFVEGGWAANPAYAAAAILRARGEAVNQATIERLAGYCDQRINLGE